MQDYNTRVVILGTTLLGMSAGMIGSFALLRTLTKLGVSRGKLNRHISKRWKQTGCDTVDAEVRGINPLQAEFESTRPLIREMKKLQDCLGELQDTRVLTESLSHELEQSAIENARRLREMALREETLPDEPPGTIFASSPPSRRQGLTTGPK